MIKKALILLSLLIPTVANAYECTKQIKSLAREYEINISCDPRSYAYNSSIHGEQSEYYLLNNFSPYLKSFLDSYPKDFVKKNIKNLYLATNLLMNSYPVAGLSDGKNIWVKTMIYNGTNKQFYFIVLHHEFSSNILKNDYADQRQWKIFSIANYDESLSFFKENLTNYEFSRSVNHQLLEEGFINNYAKTNPENDFNTYAETLFTNPEKMKTLSLKFKIIDRKLSFLKDVYRKNGFTGKFPDEP